MFANSGIAIMVVEHTLGICVLVRDVIEEDVKVGNSDEIGHPGKVVAS